jgi:hypothetical protein
MNILKDIIFHENETNISNGNEFVIINNANSITFEITGSSSSRTIEFEGKSLSGEYYSINCINLTSLSLTTQTTGNNELWQVDLTGLVSFRTRISAISGGNVTIKGRVVE